MQDTSLEAAHTTYHYKQFNNYTPICSDNYQILWPWLLTLTSEHQSNNINVTLDTCVCADSRHHYVQTSYLLAGRYNQKDSGSQCFHVKIVCTHTHTHRCMHYHMQVRLTM